MDYESEIYLLSQNFLSAYPNSEYPELMLKQGRPYSCLLIDTHCDYFICVPYRSSISHKNSYIFKNTCRSKKTRSGLDYSKIAIIENNDYIDSKNKAIVDKDEYNETMIHLNTIVNEVIIYVEGYVNHINGSHPLHQREFERKYKFSTLPYFHKILGLQ